MCDGSGGGLTLSGPAAPESVGFAINYSNVKSTHRISHCRVVDAFCSTKCPSILEMSQMEYFWNNTHFHHIQRFTVDFDEKYFYQLKTVIRRK